MSDLTYTPTMWDVATEDGLALGYIELVTQPGRVYYAATYVDGTSQDGFGTYDAAGNWLKEQEEKA